MAKVAKKKSKKVVAKKAPTARLQLGRSVDLSGKTKRPLAKKNAVKKKAAKRAPPVRKHATKKTLSKKPAAKAKPKLAAKRPAPRKAKTAPAKPKPVAAAKKRAPTKASARSRRPDGDRGRKDGGRAFLPDSSETRSLRVKDDFAEELGEEFVATATSGEAADDARDAVVPEEDGGPFVTTTAESQYAEGTDASNPADAEREPFPTTHGGAHS
jgi:hypothetical protein